MKKEFKGNNPGKGSARRKENFKKVQKNWDLIDWGHSQKDKRKNYGTKTRTS